VTRPSASIAPDSPPLSVTPNPLFVPPHLLPYILPPFRRLYLNGPAPNPLSTDNDESVPSSAPEGVEKINARLHMENAALRQSCHAWRARANAHVAAHLGLSALLRLARNQTRTLKDERDELSRKYDALKRKFSDVVRELSVESESDDEEDGSVLDWTGSAVDEDETGTRAAKSEGVPCVPLAGPTASVSPSVSGPGAPEDPRGNPKRRKLSPPRSPSIYSEVAAKSATSIPAMVIPHLVSHHRSVASIGPGRSTVD